MLYQLVHRLFTDLALARGDGGHPRLLRALGRVDLLILDDWGLELLDAPARHDLLEILEDRYGLAVDPETIMQIHDRIVQVAQEQGVTQGRRMRVDTTVVETNIHYPTDSTLLGDGVS